MSDVYDEALRLSMKGKYLKAVMLLRRDGNQRDPKTWLLIGQLYTNIEGKVFDAIDAFRKAKNLNPQCVRAYCFIARAFEDSGKLDSAERIIDEGLTENPGSAELWVEKASLYISINDFHSAFQIAKYLEACDCVIAAYKIQAQASELLAQEDDDPQLLRDALGFWEAIIQQDPKDYDALMGREQTLELLGKYQRRRSLLRFIPKVIW